MHISGLLGVSLGTLLVASSVDAASPTLLSASGGPIPVPYNLCDYRCYPSQPLDIAKITDHNLTTGITLEGFDAILQSNGAIVDTAPFALFRYQLDPGNDYFELKVHAQVDYQPPANELLLEVLNLRDNLFHALYIGPANLQNGVEIAIHANGNTGNTPPSQGISIFDVISPTNELTFAIQFGYAAPLNMPGHLIGHLREIVVNASGVPEPTNLLMLGIGIGLAYLIQHRRDR